MRDDDYGEDRDPLLVRPFLRQDSGAVSDESTQTWPSATTREVRSQRAFEGADDPTAIIELPADRAAALRRARHARPARRRRLLLLGAAGAVILLGVAAAGFAAVRSDVRPLVSAAAPGEPLPAATAPAPSTPPSPAGTPASTRPAATKTTGAARTSAASSRTPPVAVPSLPRFSPSVPIAAPTTAAPVPPPDNRLAPPPSTDHTGAIRGQNGLCLDLDGGIAVDGNRVQVFDCNGSPAQAWTLAADGTLRVSGTCAVPAGDGSVRIAACDGRTTAQWQPSGQLLINGTGGCLTDPSGGRASGTAVIVAPCGGSANQRWSLP